MLKVQQHVDKEPLLKFICSTFDPIVGGFMKAPDGDSVGKRIFHIKIQTNLL